MNLEIEMLNKLKAEIKAELKEEIKAEILIECKDEIVQDAIKKIDEMIFMDRIFEKKLTAYIGSLCHNEVHFLRMLNRGLVEQGKTYYEFRETSSGKVVLEKRKDFNIEKLYNEYKKAEIIKCEYKDFKSVLEFKSDCKPIAWNDKGKKKFTYKGLFKIYNRVYHVDNLTIKPLRERFLRFLANNFTFEGEFKKYSEIKKSFDKLYPLIKS